MATDLAYVVTQACASPRPPPSRKVGDLLPVAHSGDQLPSDGWARVIFQVFWWPPPGPYEVLSCKRVVMLGEAVAPPMSALGVGFRAHRLPIHRFQRRQPQGAAPFEELQQGMDSYVASLKKRLGRTRQKFAVRAGFLARRAEEDLLALERDLASAFPGSFPDLGATEPPAKGALPQHLAAYMLPERSKPATKGSPPEAILPEADLYRDLPSAYSGPCYLDVDLAFSGPASPEKGLRKGLDGTFAFDIHSLRFPPLDHGYVCIRVCEAAVQRRAPQRCRTPSQGRTQNGAALESFLMASHRAPTPPESSPSHPLWSSPSVMLGSWANTTCGPQCAAVWAQAKASASLWVTPEKQVIHRTFEQDAFPHTAREAGGHYRGLMFKDHVTPAMYEWNPVVLACENSLPRSKELLLDSAMIHATHPLLTRTP
ncbi:unnamed protein product [Effrenium voratum]|nr:unnamed protein product [Effrenium voratum]